MVERRTTVHISKAQELDLGNDESSINEFAAKVRDGVRVHMIKALKLKDDFDVFVADIFPTAAVVDVMQFKKSQPPARRLFKVPFRMDSNGELEFGAATPVRRRTTYTAIAKSELSFWDTLSA